MSAGVSLFDRDGRLVLCNTSYGELYGLTPDETRPGASLREITERRIAAGTCPMSLEDYLALSTTRSTPTKATRVWTLALGRRPHGAHPSRADGRRRLGVHP